MQDGKVTFTIRASSTSTYFSSMASALWYWRKVEKRKETKLITLCFGHLCQQDLSQVFVIDVTVLNENMDILTLTAARMAWWCLLPASTCSIFFNTCSGIKQRHLRLRLSLSYKRTGRQTHFPPWRRSDADISSKDAEFSNNLKSGQGHVGHPTVGSQVLWTYFRF